MWNKMFTMSQKEWQIGLVSLIYYTEQEPEIRENRKTVQLSRDGDGQKSLEERVN